MTKSEDVSTKTFEMAYPGRVVQSLQRLGLTDSRNMLWSWYEPRNFGDWIGPYLFLKWTAQAPLHCKPRQDKPSRAKSLATAGSILRHIEVPDRVRVWGSGIISMQDEFARPIEVLAVRGPYSRERLAQLGYPTTDVYGDPGLLLPEVYAPERSPARFRLGLIPHYLDYAEVRSRFEGHDAITIIDVTRPIETVVDDILACECTLSASLHGLILSQAYGIPCAWTEVEQAGHGDGIKYFDYLESTGVSTVTGPCLIEAAMTVDEMTDIAKAFPVGNITELVPGLLATCPFLES